MLHLKFILLSSIVYQNCMELIIIKCLNVAFEIYIDSYVAVYDTW